MTVFQNKEYSGSSVWLAGQQFLAHLLISEVKAEGVVRVDDESREAERQPDCTIASLLDSTLSSSKSLLLSVLVILLSKSLLLSVLVISSLKSLLLSVLVISSSKPSLLSVLVISSSKLSLLSVIVISSRKSLQIYEAQSFATS